MIKITIQAGHIENNVNYTGLHTLEIDEDLENILDDKDKKRKFSQTINDFLELIGFPIECHPLVDGKK